MVGIGPFISHKDTPFKELRKRHGGADDLFAFINPPDPARVLLPATTALGTIDPMGREKGIMAGANVLMPKPFPVGVTKKYYFTITKSAPRRSCAMHPVPEKQDCKNGLRNRYR
jgi:biotin synthase